ncbi:MAG TPA: hypothetical protein PLW66_00145 [Saprospiraceae bacterium]|nr:hypothetical protein [Saprospiraceae bacterium]
MKNKQAFPILDTDTVASKWNQFTLDAIATTRTSPPVAARVLAMVHTAMYNAWTAYDDCAVSTATYSRLRRPASEHTQENWQKAYSYAAYRVLVELSWLLLPPEDKDETRLFMTDMGYDPDNTTFDISCPEGVGNLCARMELDRHFGDGSNSHATLKLPTYADYTDYQASNPPIAAPAPFPPRYRPPYPKLWQPLIIDGDLKKFLLPQWGLVKPFALEHPWQFRPEQGPAGPGDPDFARQMDELIHLSAGLTDEQKMICEFWLGGPGTITPPGIWCDIAQFVSRRDKHADWQDVMMFFALTNALYDASIAAWDAKRKFDTVRPITAIRLAFNGKFIDCWAGPNQGTQSKDGAGWLPYQPLSLVTPAFPEFVSGHSTFSSAAACVLELYTGSDRFGGQMILEKGSSIIETGTPKTDITLYWPKFSEAAVQAGYSRRIGGIHFEDGDEQGRVLGGKVAECVWNKVCVYFNGKPLK